MRLIPIYLSILCYCEINVYAKPVIPKNDNQVLQILPTKAIKNDLRIAREKWQAEPQNINNTVALARLYITESRQTADPRYLGYAEALIISWKTKSEVPIPIRLISATIAQRNHQFEAALADIELVLREDPFAPEALLTQAAIYQVQANYEAAKKNCKKLSGLSTLMLGIACTAQMDGLTGHGEKAFEKFSTLLKMQNAGLTIEVREWILLNYIDLAIRLGREKEAADGFSELMANTNATSEAKAFYADWLLTHQRFNEVIELTSKNTNDDGLLLRLIIAESALYMDAAKAHKELLSDRFASAKLRGDEVHQREESRFLLEVLHKPKEALKLAQDNWKVQREPADALILLNAVIAANEPNAALSVLEWMKQSGIQGLTLKERAALVSKAL